MACSARLYTHELDHIVALRGATKQQSGGCCASIMNLACVHALMALEKREGQSTAGEMLAWRDDVDWCDCGRRRRTAG